MRQTAMVVASVVLAMTGPVLAQTCPSGTVQVTGGAPAADGNGGSSSGGSGGGNFTNFIAGARICAARGLDRWQEFHQSGGALFDWKLGSGHAVDPRKQVGTWSASNGANAAVTHRYVPDGDYSWIICRPNPGPGTYTMVSTRGGTVTGVKVFPTDGACP